MKLFSEKLSQIHLVLLVAGFLTLTGNFTFFKKTLLVYPLSENLFFLGSLFIFLFTFLAALLLLLCYKKTTKLILILLLFTSSLVSYSINNYGIVFDHNMITNTFESDPGELRDLINFKSILYFLVLGLLPSLFVFKVELKKLTIKAQFLQRLKYFIVLVVIFIVVVLSFSKHYTSFARENRDLRLYITPTYYLYSAAKYFDSKMATSSTPFKVIGLDAQINKKSDKQRLVIFVIGETARRDHMSINGYDLQTNPYLEQEEIISFKNLTSCGTDTAWSVPCMFSLLGRDKYSHAKGKNMSNVLDLISHAGASVIWYENNSSSKSVADRITFEDYRTSEQNSICNPECRDEGMLVNLQSHIDDQNGKDVLIILHTMGSHGPAYYKRYPEEFEVFVPVCKTSQLNECNDQEISNAYDNTILYADYFLSKVIGLLKRNSQELDTAMFYISDHGESLGENGLYLHGMPYFMAPNEQIDVPALLWLNDSMSKVFNVESIKKKESLPLSHDNLFHTLLGLMDVETKLYNKNLDLMAE